MGRERPGPGCGGPYQALPGNVAGVFKQAPARRPLTACTFREGVAVIVMVTFLNLLQGQHVTSPAQDALFTFDREKHGFNFRQPSPSSRSTATSREEQRTATTVLQFVRAQASVWSFATGHLDNLTSSTPGQQR